MAARSTIKGLTVEIGGDTTKLGKALESVHKKSDALSRELGEINKLLKLDPGNAELLAQKQQVLADAVTETSEKLRILREAEKQVQKQFERGEVSEAQVRELQREILATTKKLDGYERAARETAEAVEALGDSSDDVRDGTKKAEKGADEASDALDDLADSAGKADKAGDGLGKKMGGVVVTGLKAVAAAATAAIGALVGSAEASREYRSNMGKLGTAFEVAGHSGEAATKTYQTLQGVLGESDQAVEAANHLAKLCDNEKELSTWTNIATGVYATFGDSLPIENLTEAANETAKTGAITGGLADALNWAGVSEDEFQASLDKCATEQERQALITETLNGLYTEAAEKYRETNAEVIHANEANEQWAAAMAEVGGSMEPIVADIKLMGASLLSDLLPGVKEVSAAFRGLLNGDEGAAEGLGSALSGLLTSLVGKLTELLPVLVDVAVSLVDTLMTTVSTTLLPKITELLPTIIQAAISLATSLITTLIEMVPQLVTTGMQLITAILEGVTSAIPQIVQALVDMAPKMVEAVVSGIPLLMQGALKLFLAIVDAIPLLLPPLIAAIPQIVMCLVDTLMGAIPTLIQGALKLLLAIVDAVPLLVQALTPAIPKIVTTIVLGLLDSIPVLLDAAVELLLAIVKAIPQICVALIKALPQIGTTMFNYFKQLPSKLWAILKSLVSNIAKWGTESRNKAKEGAKKILTAIVDTIKQLPSKMLSAGRDLVRGLWNGINGAYTWLKNKISGWVGNVTDFLMNLFGIHSPSKVTAYMGEMLDRGLAEGIEDNTDVPTRAMSDMSSAILDEGPDGLALTKRINHSFGAGDVAAFSGADMLGKLDAILAAIQAGQVIALDGKTLIGSTAAGYDSTLGQRRMLAARGAL